MKKILTFIFFLLMLFTATSSYAEFCDDFPLDPDCGDPDSAPIDSGVGLLIGAAAFYTAKKIREKKGNNESLEVE